MDIRFPSGMPPALRRRASSALNHLILDEVVIDSFSAEPLELWICGYLGGYQLKVFKCVIEEVIIHESRS